MKIVFVCGCVGLLATLSLAQAPVDHSLSQTPGIASRGIPPIGGDNAWSDNFNRSDAPTLGGDWIVNSGSFAIAGNTGRSTGTGASQWVQHAYASRGYASAAQSIDLVAGTGARFVALIFSADGTDKVFLKVQDNNGDGTFDAFGFYKGINGGTWSGGTPFGSLATPFTQGRMHCYFTGGGNVAHIDLDHDFNGTIDEALTSPGLLASGLVLNGTAMGIGCWNTATFDDWLAGDGTPVAPFFQTLPSGYSGLPGNNSTSFPLDSVNDQKWQWHYDNANFAQSGPITIRELYVRARAPASVAAFDFPSVVVTLSEATTDYQVANHDPEFAKNLGANTLVVRTGPWTGAAQPSTGGAIEDWIPIGLQKPFTYDPTKGNDFIVQIEKCGTNAVWAASLEGVSGAAGTVLGNRYGDTGNCSPTTHSFNNNEFVPLVRIDFEPATQTLPAGYGTTQGNAGTAFPVNTANPHKWQWHYDNSNFAMRHPIEIRELYVRASSGVAVGPFDFPNFVVTLASATTGYEVGSHDPIFANNLAIDAKVVKSNAWTSPGTPADAWIPIKLEQAFYFDPRSGRDFIVQIEKCTSTTLWGTSLNGNSAGAGLNGGNRYGHTTDCAAAIENFSNNEFVPIVRMDFVPASQIEPLIYCAPKLNGLGCYPVIGWEGNSSATQASGFDVTCTNARNQKSGLLFYGVNGRRSTPFQGGLHCVNPPIRRTPGQVSGGTASPANDCSGEFRIDMNAFAAGGLGGTPAPQLLIPGTAVDCQWWGRDPGFPAPNNTMLSNAMEYYVGL